MTSIPTRVLQPGDEAVLEAFLVPRIASSMFLLGNMRHSGLIDGGKPYQGTYVAAFEGQRITSVVAHYWNGNLVTQAPVHLGELWPAAVQTSGREIRGVLGPDEQVSALKDELHIHADDVQMDESENLYRLDLDQLIVPQPLSQGRVVGRRIEPRDLDVVSEYSSRFCIEALGDEDNADLRVQCRASMERHMQEGTAWILELDGVPVSTSAFNTATKEAVQIGGVWTPPELRGRGYARAVVAASLLDARADGARLAVLFTGRKNVAAQKAYQALGFGHIGDYRILLLRSGVRPGAAPA